MNATCPVEMLKAMHDTVQADLDRSARDDGNVLVSRLGAIQDTILAHEGLSPSGLRLQADIIRKVTDGVDHGEHMNAIARLAAAYADRLATTPAPAPVPASPDRQATMRLCDTAVHLLDALGAVNMAVDGVDDEAQIRSLRFLVEKTQDIACEIDAMARSLHHATPTTDDGRDSDLRNLITAYRVAEERIAETDSAPEHVERSKRLLAKIAETEAHTVRGALAKVRICFDDDEIEREMQDGAPIESVGASGLRDLFKLTGEA